MSAPSDLSETGMANGALALIGEPPIASLDDTTRAAARVAKRYFAETRDELLRERPWQFARHSCVPSAWPAAPNTAWLYRYAMPDDCIAIKTIGEGPDQTPAWESPSSGDDGTVAVLLDTDEVSPLVWYTRRVVNPAQWDPLFRRVFKSALAAKINPVVGRDKGLTAQLAGATQNWLDDAAVRDARQRNGDQLTRTTSWLRSRWGYAGGGVPPNQLPPANDLSLDISSTMSTFTSEVLTVTAPNTLSSLTHIPDGNAFSLIVNGASYFPATGDCSYFGLSVTWSGSFTLTPGAATVVAAYTYTP